MSDRSSFSVHSLARGKRLEGGRRRLAVALSACCLAVSCTKKTDPAGEPKLRPLAPAENIETPQANAPSVPEVAKAAPASAPLKSDQGAYFDVSWDFNYINFPGKVAVYQVDPDWNYDMSQTRIVALGKLPFTKKARMPFRMNSRGRATLALVVENTTNQPWYFFANFHQLEPSKNGYGLQMLCLCINHLFEVPANSAWYRIVGLWGRRITGGRRVSIRHDVVGMTKEEVERKRIEAAVHSAERE